MRRGIRSMNGLLAAVAAILVAVGILGLTAPVAAQDDGSVTVQLAEENDSGVTGTAVLTADGDQTNIVVDLDGAEEGYEGHTFDSSCDDHRSATVFYAIEAVDADGHSESVVEAPLSELTSGDFWIHMHRPAGERGEGVACGQILAAAGTGGSLPDTGVGPIGRGSTDAWLLAGLAMAAGALGASWPLRKQGAARG
ncbi:MAG: hypothetical protein QOJ59_1102 [Thermomicrobiales bacterium]|nr:hypothetical protein [Thermomicrobiales bacterium]